MEVRSCKICKRLFNYITGQPICPNCKEELEKKFQEVKKYINENKGATIQSVSKEIDVPEFQIRQWIKEERLVFANASVAGVVCELCGTPITTGRYCDKCKVQTANMLNSALPKSEVVQAQIKKEKENPRMRFLDNR